MNKFLAAALLLVLTACAEPQSQTRSAATPSQGQMPPGTLPSPAASAIQAPPYSEVFKITYSSCLPCHNRYTLPQVIDRVRQANFQELEGETRLRILSELEGLKELIDSDSPLTFTLGHEELLQNYAALPGAFYIMLEKGVMPPPWAPELMQAIDWPNYVKLSTDKRHQLLRFAQPYSARYVYGNSGQAEAPLPRPPADDTALLAEAKLSFQPLTAPSPGPAAQIALGRQLFHDPRLSVANTVSCKTCHNLDSAGIDKRPTAVGHLGQVGRRNTPTVLNAFLNQGQFWDARAKDLADQAGQPILNPTEMAMPDEASVLRKLQAIPGYVSAFETAFAGQTPTLSYAHLREALARFEETLVTPGRFDRFLAGDAAALDAAEKRGLRQFLDRGCVACHDGPGLGGRSLHKLGVTADYPNQTDLGRFEVTHAARDRMVFKVPLLRNIAETGPYFHDGRTSDLKDAVKIMAKLQLGKDYTDAEIGDLVAFLKSLSGELPAAAKTPPALP